MIPSSKQLLSQAWQIYKQHYKLFIKIYLAPCIVFVVAVPLLFLVLLASKSSSLPFLVSLPVFLVLILVGVYITLWSQAALIKAVEGSQQSSEPVSFKQAFINSRGKIWVLLGASLLAGLATFGGILLAIIPGIIWGTWYSMCSYVAVCESTTAAQALRISKGYVRGRTRMVLGRWIVLGLIYVAISIILQIIFSASSLSPNVTGTVRNVITGLLWTPFSTVYGYLLYVSLKNHPLTAEKQLTN